MKRLVAIASSVVVAGCQPSTEPGLPTVPTMIVQPPAAPDSGPFPIPSTPISAGQHVMATITRDNPACFPNWDSSGLCRQFDLIAPRDGTLTATLKWTGPSLGMYDPDLFVVSPDGNWWYSSDSWPEKRRTVPIKNGLTYRIVVLSYGQSLDFELSAEVQS